MWLLLEDPLHASLLASGGRQPSLAPLAYSDITPTSACLQVAFPLGVWVSSVFGFKFPSYKVVVILDLESTLFHYDLILTW